MKRPPNLAFGEGRVGRSGALSRSRRIEPDDGVEAAIVFLDADQEMLQHLDGAYLSLSDQPGDLSGRFEVQVHSQMTPFY
jgi:hypothetical protein